MTKYFLREESKFCVFPHCDTNSFTEKNSWNLFSNFLLKIISFAKILTKECRNCFGEFGGTQLLTCSDLLQFQSLIANQFHEIFYVKQIFFSFLTEWTVWKKRNSLSSWKKFREIISKVTVKRSRLFFHHFMYWAPAS